MDEWETDDRVTNVLRNALYCILPKRTTIGEMEDLLFMVKDSYAIFKNNKIASEERK